METEKLGPEKVGDKLKIKIEKNIPVPIKIGGRTAELRIILQAMKLEESFVCHNITEIRSCQAAINYIHRTKNGRRFTSRTIAEGEKRFWRVK